MIFSYRLGCNSDYGICTGPNTCTCQSGYWDVDCAQRCTCNNGRCSDGKLIMMFNVIWC